MSGAGIVVGMDGSPESLLAVEWAAREAILRQAPLLIVSVLERWLHHDQPGSVTHESVTAMTGRSERAGADSAAKFAAQRAAELAPDLRIETSVPEGSPARQLLASAADAQMLVVGCRGSGGFSGLVLGSISRYLATHAPMPVVVTREETVAADHEVVIGLRRTRQAGAAVRFAFTEAAVRRANLVVIEALPGRLAAIADVKGDVLAAIAAQLETDLAGLRAKYPGVKVRIDVVDSHPGRVLAAASARADLVVLGRHGSHSEVLGTVHAVLGHAHGPVAVVPGE